MLAIQQWLRENNFNYDLLKETYGIKANFHPTDERVILNYDQIDSYKFKTEKIVRECRALCLNRYTADLVGRGFYRFFNLNEVDEKYDWSEFTCYSKEDGSLILVYWYKDRFYIQTRNSYSEAEINTSGMKWRELVEQTLPDNWRESFIPGRTYVFEVCSQYNKIVRTYPISTLFCLSIFDGENELSVEDTNRECETLNLAQPNQYNLHSIEEIQLFLENKEKNDPTFEGIVARFKDDRRVKIKSKSYLIRHKLYSKTWKTQDLIEIILSGEQDEILVYMPELSEKIQQLIEKIECIKVDLARIITETDHIVLQKDFAMKIKHLPYAPVLFNARKLSLHPHELLDSVNLTKMVEKLYNII